MNDATVKVNVNAIPLNAEIHANSKGFDMTLFPIPGIFRGLAEQSVGRVKENCEKMKVASGEIADNLRDAYASNAKGAADYGAKVIEISNINTQSAFDFLTSLMATKSLSGHHESFGHAEPKEPRSRLRTKQRALGARPETATETAEPIKKSFTRVPQPVS